MPPAIVSTNIPFQADRLSRICVARIEEVVVEEDQRLSIASRTFLTVTVIT